MLASGRIPPVQHTRFHVPEPLASSSCFRPLNVIHGVLSLHESLNGTFRALNLDSSKSDFLFLETETSRLVPDMGDAGSAVLHSLSGNRLLLLQYRQKHCHECSMGL